MRRFASRPGNVFARAETIAAELTVAGRVPLFCLASDTEDYDRLLNQA